MRWRFKQWRSSEDTMERGESTNTHYDFGRLQFYAQTCIPKISQTDDRFINALLNPDADTNDSEDGIEGLIKRFDDLEALVVTELEGKFLFLYTYHRLQSVLQLIQPISVAMEGLEPSLRRISFVDSDTKHTYPEFYLAMRQHINNIGQHLRDSQFRLPTFLADFGQPSCDIAIAIVVIVALVTGFMGASKGPTYSELIKLTTVTTTIVAPLLYIRSTAQLVKRIMNARNALFQGVVMFIWSWKKFDTMQRRHTDGERVSVQKDACTPYCTAISVLSCGSLHHTDML
ncbi:hypothetical protein ARMSODRAFT_350128 [Armillaria solidipes]|uniref:Uncharacterized protein n=1 Tax=Armillaria solidipes TaxID=1076256 RepID=A0A2H3B6N1_9AGAR|nr:hypothetical protein ARMSODRAFT_350128 [Armillaria solidipes]